jgi:hypothetical protein
MTVATDSKYREEPITEELLIQTGRSALANIITTYQTLSALEDAIFINRLTKSTEFKIVQVDVSESNNKQARQILDAVKNAFKSSETIDMTTERYQNRQSPIPINDFIYIPTKGAKGSVQVSTIGGEVGEQKLADIEYYRNKLFAGLAVLKAYLGFEETTPGGLGDSTLTMLDERLGRKIKRFQLVLKGIIRQMVSYYWRYSGADRNLQNMPDFDILLGKVSTKEDEAKQQRLDKSLDTAVKIVNMAKDELFIEKIDPDKLFDYIFRDVIGIDPAQFDNQPNEDTINVRVKEIGEGIKTIQEAQGTKEPSKKVEEIREKIKHRKFMTEVQQKSLSRINELLGEYDIFVENEDGTSTHISEVLESKKYKLGILSEKTFNQLKDASKSQDPVRLAKSKKLTVKYNKITKDNLLDFTVTAEDPSKNAKEGKPTSYNTKIALKDLAYLIKATIEDDEQLTEADLVNLAIQGDMSLDCTCPAASYWGQHYLGTQQDYSLTKEERPPKRNIPTQPVCKHTLATLTVLPFWYNTIVRDLRNSGLLPSVMSDDDKKQVLASDI